MSFVAHSYTPLKKDAEGSAAGDALKAVMAKAFGAPGLQHAFKGTPLDASEPPASELFTLWDSAASVQAASSGADGEAVKKAFADVADTSDPAHPPSSNVFELSPEFTAVAVAPVVQMMALVMPADKVAGFDAQWAKLSAEGAARGKPDGLVAMSQGWGLREIDLPGDGGKVKVFLMATGWESAANAEAATAAGQAMLDTLKDTVVKTYVRVRTLEKLK